MNLLRNSVRLIGHLGADPEIKDLGQKKLAKFSLATNDSYRNEKGETVKETQWHNLVAWGRQAGVVERYLKKGSEIAIEGKITSKSYVGKDGVKRYNTEIVVSDLMMFKGNTGSGKSED